MYHDGNDVENSVVIVIIIIMIYFQLLFSASLSMVTMGDIVYELTEDGWDEAGTPLFRSGGRSGGGGEFFYAAKLFEFEGFIAKEKPFPSF